MTELLQQNPDHLRAACRTGSCSLSPSAARSAPACSVDMAVRLAVVFGTEPEIWINLQAQYDLWLVSQQSRPKVKRLAA